MTLVSVRDSINRLAMGPAERRAIARGELILSNTIDIRQAGYDGSCDKRTTTVSANAAPGVRLFVAGDVGFRAGHGIFVSGGAAGGADYIGTVVSAVSLTVGQALTLNPALGAAVPAGAWVAHDDTAAVKAAVADFYARYQSIGLASGRILGSGTSLINGPLEGPAGSQGIIFLPQIPSAVGSVPLCLSFQSLAEAAWSDQGSVEKPAAAGWILECNKDDRAGEGAMFSGAPPTGVPTWPFTFCFLDFCNVSLRAPRGPMIHGVNGYGIGRLSGDNFVVEVGACTTVPVAYDKYAIRGPAFNGVPLSHFVRVTVADFKRGIEGFERLKAEYVYAAGCDYPVTVEDGATVIAHMVADRFHTAFRSTRGGTIDCRLAELDQGRWVVNDELLRGSITYSRGSGAMGVRCGSRLSVRRIDSEAREAALSRAVTYGTPVMVPLKQESLSWYDLALLPSGDNLATVFGGRVRIQTNGRGAFAPMDARFLDALGNPTSLIKNFSGCCVDRNHGIYVAEFNGDIWYKAPESADFVALGQLPRGYTYMAASPNGDVYVVVWGSDVFVRAGGVGDFVGLGVGANDYSGICVVPSTLDVWLCIYGGGVSKRAAGVGTFTDQGQASRNWNGITPCGSDLLAVVRNGDVYRMTNRTGALTALGVITPAWYTIRGASDGSALAAVNAGDIYSLATPVLSPAVLAAT